MRRFRDAYKRPVLPASVKASPPVLTRVCKQIRSETLVLFYGANTFNIHFGKVDGISFAKDVLKKLYKWVLKIGAAQRAMVKHVILNADIPLGDRVRWSVLRSRASG